VYNPFAPGFPRGFAPSGFGPGFGSYPFPGIYCKDIAGDQWQWIAYTLLRTLLHLMLRKCN